MRKVVKLLKLPKYFEDNGKVLFHFIRTKRKLRITGIKDMEYEELIKLVEDGEKFVVFRYDFSVLVASIEGVSPIYFSKSFFRSNFAKVRYIFLCSLLLIMTLLFTFAIIYTVGEINLGVIIPLVLLGICCVIPIPSLLTNFRGGIDVTKEVLAYIEKLKNDTEPK